MLSPDIQHKIRRLQIVTKGMMEGPLIGDDISSHRGYGIEFHQMRDYYTGDDVRFIDWKSSCRLNKLMIKECLEERNRRVIIAIDVSGSSGYSSQGLRFEKLREIGAILAFAAHYGKDSIGLVLFSDDIELEIEPQHVSSYVHFLIHSLYSYQLPTNKKTNLSVLFNYIGKRWYKDALVFVISDFIDNNFGQSLQAAASCVDLIAVRCFDTVERKLPSVGYLTMEDIELGEICSLNTNSCNIARMLAYRRESQNELFNRTGVDFIDVNFSDDVCVLLVDFFKRRMIHASMR